MPRDPESRTPALRRATRLPRKYNRCQAMIRQHDQLSSLVRADAPSCQMALMQDPYFSTVARMLTSRRAKVGGTE